MSTQPPRIETWFPKTVYIRDDVCSDLLPELEKKCKEIKTVKTESFQVESTHLTNRYLHKEEYFSELSSAIMDNFKFYMDRLGYCEDYISQCFIGNMWCNTSNSGGFLFPHSHPGCIMAGAFYVKTIDENQIVFYDSINPPFEPPKYDNPLNWSTTKYNCDPARLLMFRSNMIHGTPRQENEGEKIVISFNIVKAISAF
jgi:uncharacterized protein (TIGR02466 family)